MVSTSNRSVDYKMSPHRRIMDQILILVMSLYVMEVHSMSDITQNLLTPMKEEGEACGYESCPGIVPNVLNVHVVPSTHGELGYTRTFDSHFNGLDDVYAKSNVNMKRILDFVISELWKSPERKFTFTDLPYLFQWWKVRHPTVHRMFYQLLRQGRIHIVGGGWSMTDESSANYHAIIDQFTYALRKLNRTFLDCARPLVSWQADSFGHTSEFASLTAQMGFDGHFINPISYDDELQRMQTQRLEFLWRGSTDLGAASDIFTHKLFDGYWAPPGFCFGGLQCEDPLIISTDGVMNNIEERVKVFIESMKHRQAPSYATNHIMIVMGQRFGYHDASRWFDNIEQLMRGVGSYGHELGVDVVPYYSSPICYLKAVYESNITLDLETVDFVPVAYDKKTHFAGLFSSRPTVKYAVRIGHTYLQISKQLQALGALKDYSSYFEDFHWIVGVMQDHNILSGGMRPYVRDYYINKLYQSVKASERIIKDGIVHLLKSPSHIHYSRCLFNISYCELTDRDNFYIVIYNPLAWPVSMPVRLPCVTNSEYIVHAPDSKKIKTVIMNIPTAIKRIPYPKAIKCEYELVFFAENIPALGLHSYYVEKVIRKKRSVKLFADTTKRDNKLISKNDKGILKKDKATITLFNKGNTIIVKKDITTPKDLVEDRHMVVEKYSSIISEMKILRDIVSEIRKDTAANGAYKKDNTTGNVARDTNLIEEKGKNTDKRSKRDFDDTTIDLEQIHGMLKSLLDKYKNTESDNVPKMAKNLKKYLKYYLKINLLEKEKNRRINDMNEEKAYFIDDSDHFIDTDSSEENKLPNKTNEKTNKESKKYPFGKMALIPFAVDKHLDHITETKNNKNKRSVPIYKEQKHINNGLEKNVIIDKDQDINIGQYVIPLREKNKYVTQIKREDESNLLTERKRIKFSDKEFNKERNDKIKYYLREGMHIPEDDTLKTYRFKRITKELNNLDSYNSKLISKQNSIGKNIFIHNAQSSFMPTSIYDEHDILMPNKINIGRIKFLKNQTHDGEDTIPDKTYDSKDINQIYDMKDIPNNTSEEDIITDKFDFDYRPQNTTLKLIFPSNISNVNTYYPLKQDRSKVKVTETPRDYTTESTQTTNLAKTTRPERSLIKKIKNAKKKYLRRQTNNLKIDDEGLLKSNNYDDEDEDASFEYYDENVAKDNRTENDEVVRSMKVEHIPIVTTVRTTTVGTTDRTTTSTSIGTSTSTKAPTTVKRDAVRSKDDYIGNQYINISLSTSRHISNIRLANGVAMSLTVNFYYYASDDPMKMGRPHDKKPGAYVFSPMDNEPVLIEDLKVEVLKSELVEEIHFTGNLISYIVRLYKNLPYFELTWICNEIPVADGIGKDVFVRYKTDLDTGGVFYTDSNGRQTMKRSYGQRANYVPADPTSIPGNYYPVTSKITIQDTRKLIRFSVFNDRTQGGTSSNGEIDLMLNRRILTDDAGIQTFLNETEPVSGKHYFYLTKLNSKPNRIFEKKLEKELGLSPQIFISTKVLSKSNWDGIKKNYTGLNKKLPVGLNILTLQYWNDGTLLLRIENYLEKSDVIKNGIKKIVLKDLFSRFDVVGVNETTLAGNIWWKDYMPLPWKLKKGETRNEDSEPINYVDHFNEIEFTPQQIRTFVIDVKYK